MKSKILKQTLYSFLELIERRDGYTAGHSVRVAFYATELAKELGLNDDEIELVHNSALIHDIGKIGIPDSILLKPDKLSIEEFSIMKEHVNIGFQTIKSIDVFSKHASIIKDHHEKFNGEGYPDGKKENEISIYSYILSLADSFDALTTARIYNNSKTAREAVDILKEQEGNDFPFGLVKSLENVLLTQELNDYKKQKPEDDIEDEKYAFHFKDTLTGVYSYSYLNYFILENVKYHEYRCVYYFYLKNMSLYNKDMGWDRGDDLLKQFAEYLKSTFKHSKIFRIKGDDFIVISKDHIDYENIDTINTELFNATCVNLDVHHFDFFELNIDSMKKFEDIIFEEFGKNYHSEMKKKTISILKDKSSSYEEKLSNINLDNIIKDFDLFNELIFAQDKELKNILLEKDNDLSKYETLIDLLPFACIILTDSFKIMKINKRFRKSNDTQNVIERIKETILLNIGKEKIILEYNDMNFQINKLSNNHLSYYIILEL